MKETLHKVPRNGADNLYEAIQSFILIWQTMCLAVSYTHLDVYKRQDPQEAKEFVERTGVTSLAIAIGTAHGFYACLLYTSRCV